MKSYDFNFNENTVYNARLGFHLQIEHALCKDLYVYKQKYNATLRNEYMFSNRQGGKMARTTLVREIKKLKILSQIECLNCKVIMETYKDRLSQKGQHQYQMLSGIKDMKHSSPQVREFNSYNSELVFATKPVIKTEAVMRILN